uniref:centrosomal protein of 70 kDa-like n=1 Tax=Gasterosteus aculeatus aculeatus TaxID=481459 RepID=UPI001A99F6E9|nr:centrosomal protein of 70 kDa-like [Gasterosteus aculeatus aculeatus]
MDSGRTPSLQPRDKTFVCLWTSRQFQQEQVEWDDVNKLLQHHGFKPVHFADPGGNKNISDLIVLDKKSAGEIRMSLRTMLTDSERRQALIQELIKSNNQLKYVHHTIQTCTYFENFEVLQAQAPSSGGLKKAQKVGSIASDLAEFHTVVPTLEAWAQQLRLLKDLQRALNRLTGRLMPWKPRDGGHTVAVKVEDMLMLVDSMLENTSAEEDKVLRSPTRYTLGSMVSHFQKLFDVSSLSGVYPRMNEVYSRLEEMRNIMRNLRDVLQLDSRAPAAEVVHGVERLVSSTQNTAGFQSLLGEADIDRFPSAEHTRFLVCCVSAGVRMTKQKAKAFMNMHQYTVLFRVR